MPRAVFYDQKFQMRAGECTPRDPGPNEVQIAVSHCGICGSDMHAWMGHDERRVPPLILGHEAVGTVIEGRMHGQRVAINPLATVVSRVVPSMVTVVSRAIPSPATVFSRPVDYFSHTW